MNLKGCFSHNSDDWATPSDIYKHFIEDCKCIDPCPLNYPSDNRFNIYMHANLYINPPYSKINEWVNFIKHNLFYSNTIFLLIPSRTDTKYFHELMHLDCAIELYFIKGRLKFGDSKLSAPFPSVIIKFYDMGLRGIKKTMFIDRDEVKYIEPIRKN